MMNIRYRTLIALIIAASPTGSEATAQQLYFYPERGQSQERQQSDRYECHVWAAQQSGFDPMRQQASGAPSPEYPPPPMPEAPEGGLFRGAAGGAAFGAVGGAIGGDAGKGAAIGAGVGALFGGLRRRERMEREQMAAMNYERQAASAEAMQQSQAAAQRGNYGRAMKACMSGRGYSVS